MTTFNRTMAVARVRPLTMSRLLPISLGVVGLLLLVPGVLFVTNTGLNSEDAGVALTPLTSIPLDRIGTFHRTTVLIPDTPQWKRIRREWGEPEWIIAAVSHEELSTYCFRDLALTIRVTQREKPVPVEISYSPYEYGSGCVDGSFKFRATPGTDLSVSVLKADGRTLPSGELIIVGGWANTKDKLVGISLDRELRGFVAVTSILGFILIGSAGYVWKRRRALRRSA